MKKNDIILLDITGITAEGNGVGRYDGMAVFVPLTAIGDTVKVLLVKVKKSYAYGKALEIINPSNSRIDSDCECFSKCGGCVFRHIDYRTECKIKEDRVREAMHRIGGFNLDPQPIIPAVCTERYRNKAQYPIAKDASVGFYAVHSHRIIPCSDCALQPQEFTRISQIVSDWIKEHGISVYDEQTHKGLLRHLYLRKGVVTDAIMVVLVINGHTVPKTDNLIDRLKLEFPQKLKSVQLNENLKDTNVILGEKCRVIYGDEYIEDVLCKVRIRLSPLSFYQVNHDMAEILYEKAAEYAKPQGKTVFDLYCGAGTIGLSMAGEAKKVIGAEIIPQAARDAKFNAETNGIKNAEFICADAAVAADILAEKEESAEVVIVDPPRKGCSEELLCIIAQKFSPERVVYVSCDPATLARDCAILEKNGYKLLEYTPVDLFPRTSHVECCALLCREHKSK